jgi:hypothetical protein
MNRRYSGARHVTNTRMAKTTTSKRKLAYINETKCNPASLFKLFPQTASLRAVTLVSRNMTTIRVGRGSDVLSVALSCCPLLFQLN